jgi:hypothetical protein
MPLPLLLPVCVACRRWLESHINCPICRKDLDASDDQPSSSNMDSSSRQPGQQQQQADGDSCARGQQVRQEDVLARQVGAGTAGLHNHNTVCLRS